MNTSLFKAAIVLLAVSAAGCAMPGGTSNGGPLSSVTPQSAAPLAAPHAAAPSAVPDARRKLAGKYEGTIEWRLGTVAKTGTLETILRLHRKNILGPFRVTEDGVTTPLRIYGRIKSKTKEEAVIVFTIYNAKKGGYATGSGTIADGTFVGEAKSHVVGSAPSILINFSATKQKD
jgi:hypothetical protein